MPFIDPEASAMVRELREARGLSPEALAREIGETAARENWRLGGVDAYTIRRVEGNPATGRPGLVPTVRVRCLIGLYFGRPHQEIWKENRRVRVVA